MSFFDLSTEPRGEGTERGKGEYTFSLSLLLIEEPNAKLASKSLHSHNELPQVEFSTESRY